MKWPGRPYPAMRTLFEWVGDGPKVGPLSHTDAVRDIHTEVQRFHLNERHPAGHFENCAAEHCARMTELLGRTHRISH